MDSTAINYTVSFLPYEIDRVVEMDSFIAILYRSCFGLSPFKPCPCQLTASGQFVYSKTLHDRSQLAASSDSNKLNPF